MSTIKTLFMAVVLSAVGYGAYVVLTGPGDAPPPVDAPAWTSTPTVEMPPAPSTTATLTPEPKVLSASSGSRTGGSESTSTTPPSTWPTLPPSNSSTSTGSPAPTGNYDPFAAQGATSATGAATTTEPNPPSSAAATPPVARLTEVNVDPSPTASTEDIRAEFAGDWAKAQQNLAENRLADVLLDLSVWVADSRLAAGDRDRLLDLLDQLAGTVIYSQQHLLEPAYVTQSGDSLETVAQRYEVPPRLLANINGLPDTPNAPLQAGTQLKVVHGPFDALVDLSHDELTLFVRGRYAGRFRIRVGQDYPTPEGEFDVQKKVPHPTYYGPNGQVVGPDDPNNPLGGLALELGGKLSIHGSSPAAAGSASDSRGSIRLSTNDMRDVYDIVDVGSHVSIRR